MSDAEFSAESEAVPQAPPAGAAARGRAREPRPEHCRDRPAAQTGAVAGRSARERRPRALPGPVFVRGFIRNYARLVKLDPRDCWRAQTASAPAAALSRGALGPVGAKFPIRSRAAVNWCKYAILAAVALIPLAVLRVLSLGHAGIRDQDGPGRSRRRKSVAETSTTRNTSAGRPAVQRSLGDDSGILGRRRLKQSAAYECAGDRRGSVRSRRANCAPEFRARIVGRDTRSQRTQDIFANQCRRAPNRR